MASPTPDQRLEEVEYSEDGPERERGRTEQFHIRRGDGRQSKFRHRRRHHRIELRWQLHLDRARNPRDQGS